MCVCVCVYIYIYIILSDEDSINMSEIQHWIIIIRVNG